MRTPAQIGGHPIHPMLVSIPIGLWIFSLVADFIAMRSGAAETWHAAALYTMVGGIVGALAAAIPGLIDLMSLKDPGVKSTGIKHMAINLTIVALYVINAWMRVNNSLTPTTSMILSVIAIAMLLVSGWLGGKMVYEAGVAVHTEELGAAPARWSEGAGSRKWTPASGVMRGDRAMAADSEKPSRDASDSPRGY